MQKIHEFQFLYLFKTTGKWKQVQDLLNLQKENEMIQHNARLEVIATEQKAANIRVQFEEVNLQIAMEELKKIRYENSKSRDIRRVLTPVLLLVWYKILLIKSKKIGNKI